MEEQNSEVSRVRLKMRAVQLASQTSAFLIASQYLHEYVRLTSDFEETLVVLEAENKALKLENNRLQGK